MSQNVTRHGMLKKEICVDFFKGLTLKQQNAIVWAITQLEREEDLYPKFANGSLQESAGLLTDAASATVRATNDFIFRDGAFESTIDAVAKLAATAIRALMLLQKKRKVAWKLRLKKPVPLNEHTNGKEKETQIVN